MKWIFLYFTLILVFYAPALAYDWSTNPGTGDPNDPYQISEPNHMMSLSYNENLLNKHFILVADIDLSTYDGQEGRPEFNPIAGIYIPDSGQPLLFEFTGSFDGNFHAIKNLTMTTNNHRIASLFGILGENACIKNLYLRDLHFNGVCATLAINVDFGAVISNCHADIVISPFETEFVSGGIGGLACYNQGLIKQCSVTGSITIDGISSDSAGSLVGFNDSLGSIVQCYTDVEISGPGILAGLVEENHGIISKCYTIGSLINYSSAGALTAENAYGGSIINSYFLESSGPNNGNGTQLTDTQMKTQSSFVNWDFEGESNNGENEIWRMCVDGVDYPRLSWEFAQNGDFACGDGVDILDLEALAQNWLTAADIAPGTFNYACDANGDEQINLQDFSKLAENW